MTTDDIFLRMRLRRDGYPTAVDEIVALTGRLRTLAARVDELTARVDALAGRMGADWPGPCSGQGGCDCQAD